MVVNNLMEVVVEKVEDIPVAQVVANVANRLRIDSD